MLIELVKQATATTPDIRNMWVDDSQASTHSFE